MKISKTALRKIVKSTTLTGLTPNIGKEALEMLQAEVEKSDRDPETYALELAEKAAVMASWAGRKTIRPIDVPNLSMVTDERVQDLKNRQAQRDQKAKALFGVI